jgi:putative DNA primase/helicase
MTMAARGQKNPAQNAPKQDIYSSYVDAYAQRVQQMVASNTAPWQKPLEPGTPGMDAPYNALSGKAYSGSNALWLSMEQALRGYIDERWLTFKQAKAIGAQVRKGEKAVHLVKWVEIERKRQDAQAAPGEEPDERGRMAPMLFTVFNAQQCDGMPPAQQREQMTERERHEKCEQLLKDSGAEIVHGGARACYIPGLDRIHLPKAEQFKTMDGYYATAVHELGHWTGHESRLARDQTGQFGSQSYAREELAAEIFSFMVGQRLQIGHDPGQHAAYLQHWVQIIQNEPKAILTACRQAEKMCEHLGIQKYEHAALQTREQTQSQEHKRGQVVALPTRAAARAVPQQGDDYGMAM